MDERTVAALFVERGGVYWGLPGVDAWDEERDARTYPGPYPAVAHPPCARWSKLAAVVEARWGHKRGDDGGAFSAALLAVRRWGGVLEHPAASGAWSAFDLPRPHPRGGWQRGLCGGWSCQVEQGHYGHRARKSTWLYAFGAQWLPSLKWGPSSADAWVSWLQSDRYRDVERLPKGERAATPEPFQALLLEIARSVPPHFAMVR